jgi:DNA repair protein RadC
MITLTTIEEDAIIKSALEILDRRLRQPGETFDSPAKLRQFLRLLLAEREHEVFLVILMDSQNRMIHSEELFRGTLTQTSVYPREVVKLALKHNAGAVVFCHNHPSGLAEPSRADEVITGDLKKALALVDVKVLDHFIVASREVLSFAERGLI